MAEGEQPDDAQKTEDPTSKKLEEARKKGNIALSREVNNWIMLFAGTMMITSMMPYFFDHTTQILKYYIAESHTISGTPGGLTLSLGELTKEMLVLMAGPLILFMIAGIVGPLAQVGPLFAPEVIKMDLGKISIIKGFGRLFSQRALVEFGKGVIKIALIGVVGTLILYPYFGNIEHTINLPIQALLEEIMSLTVELMTGVLIVLFILAMIDLVYQRQDHNKKMRMTKQEVKDEYKQTEGDPLVKSKLRQLRAERARQRMMQAMPQADVVITNPTHFSIALKYKPDEMEAPICIAKGIDEVALRIREIAKQHDIIIFEAPPLARALYDTVDIDETIPPEHYKAVAEVISYVFKLKKTLN
jgi:flagellar biosynthetic protein FlhB